MNTAALKAEILKKKSFLCVGLDIDLEKVPRSIPKQPNRFGRFLQGDYRCHCSLCRSL